MRYAITLAAEVSEAHGRVPLETAARFLPLVLRQCPGEYERWALRWLARWISEAADATTERAAEIAASLAELPAEPTMLRRLLEDSSRRGGEGK